jgi:hypothetical protein
MIQPTGLAGHGDSTMYQCLYLNRFKSVGERWTSDVDGRGGVHVGG